MSQQNLNINHLYRMKQMSVKQSVMKNKFGHMACKTHIQPNTHMFMYTTGNVKLEHMLLRDKN